MLFCAASVFGAGRLISEKTSIVAALLTGVALGLAKRAVEEVAKSAKGRRRGDIAALDNIRSVFEPTINERMSSGGGYREGGGCAGAIGPAGRLRDDSGRQIHSEYHPDTSAATTVSCAVETALTAQRQCRVRMRPAGVGEMDQRGQRAVRSHLENRAVFAVAAIGCRAVEIAVVTQSQAIGWTRSIVEVEVNQCGQRAVGRHAKHGPMVSPAPLDRRAV